MADAIGEAVINFAEFLHQAIIFILKILPILIIGVPILFIIFIIIVIVIAFFSPDSYTSSGTTVRQTAGLTVPKIRPPSYSPLLSAPQIPTFIHQPFLKPQQRTFYHGTSLENAIEIYSTGLWMVGSTGSLWITDDVNIAKGYAGSNGGIVLVDVDQSLHLTKNGGGVYTYNIPDAKPFQEYYKIEGLVPVGVLDTNGKKIM